ncbi:MAG: hypothetical protein NT039_03815 [Candidatus Berkelbacteria bacterium]|nr:hypothetical protein [Candidatus Berkelbacteria bacterium]
MLKRFICTAVVVSLTVFVVLVAGANAQKGTNVMENADNAGTPATDTTQTVAEKPSPEAPATTTTETVPTTEKKAEESTPGSSSDKPLYVKIIDGEPRAIDKHGNIQPKPARRATTHRHREDPRMKSLWEYRNGHTKDQKVQWNAISTAQAKANQADAKAENLDTRVSTLEKAAKGIPWWGWLALVLGAIGTILGIWRLAGGGFRRVYY